MSAANRGSKRKQYDFYSTPEKTVYTLLDNIDLIADEDMILEPSAGNGSIVQALRNKGIKNHITSIEIRSEETEELNKISDAVHAADFLKFETCRKFDVIIGNPPYSQAQEFIDKAFELLKPDGRLIFLLRTNFLESKKRFAWWQDKQVSKLFVLSQRPSFTGRGTDATSYSWFIWQKDNEALTQSQEIRVI